MASIWNFSVRKLFVLFLFASLFVSTFSESNQFRGTRRMLGLEKEERPKNKTNLLLVSKNQTTITKSSTTPTTTTLFKKLNSTSNSTKLNSISKKKSLDLSKPITSPKNKTKSIITQLTPTENKPKSQNPHNNKINQYSSSEKKPKFRDDDDDDDDIVSEFRDLPSKFQQTLLPDLERISISSRAYINQANKEITKGFRPLVGQQYAPTIASAISCVFILLPLLLVSLIFNRFKAYFSLQKILIFIQVYLSIYFSILSLSSLATGLEPLKFFYATSQSSYICLQVLQTLAYVFYLLLLLMYLVLVFSTDTGLGSKILGLGQTIVGFSVGLHYYVAVFHKAVLHQSPKTNWKIHGIYATCFLAICLLANAERKKKAYLEDDGEEGKKS